MAAQFKRCSVCDSSKSTAEFYRGTAKCKPCYNAQTRAYASANPRRGRAYPQHQINAKRAKAYLYRYGITLEQRDDMLAAQGGVCAICRRGESGGPGWCTDHDHSCCPQKARSCGQCIRGILCYGCNTLLGHAKDSPETLLAAVAYLSQERVGV